MSCPLCHVFCCFFNEVQLNHRKLHRLPWKRVQASTTWYHSASLRTIRTSKMLRVCCLFVFFVCSTIIVDGNFLQKVKQSDSLFNMYHTHSAYANATGKQWISSIGHETRGFLGPICSQVGPQLLLSSDKRCYLGAGTENVPRVQTNFNDTSTQVSRNPNVTEIQWRGETFLSFAFKTSSVSSVT